ncbi:hypothetical protein ACKWTF_009434 [Chironomus riparius]
MNMQTIQNDADLQLLYAPLLLYLKPLANLTISINLPANVTGKTISNFEVMDKLRQMILPDTFSLLKVSKTTLELLRFDAELDDRHKLKHVIARLDGRQIKLTGFTEYVKVRSFESRSPFPTKHDWDSFFRDAKNMDEMHAGERPDTIYISNLPIRWFCPRHHENDDQVKPSEVLFKRIFEKFGEVRIVDIPICDPYRDQMKSGLTGLKNFAFDNETYFEGYVQFAEYSSFVRCMDEFRAMKLVRKDKDKLVAVNIEVNFDKTKHLSDVSIRRRKVIRERFMEKDKQKADEEEKKLRAEQEKRDKEKQKEEVRKQIQAERRKQREERRKQKNIKKITESESSDLTKKIIKEQKKLLKAQRKMESIRLLEALFDRIKSKFPADDVNGPTKGFKGFDLRNKLKKKKSKNKDSKSDDDGSQSASSVSSNESRKKSKKRRDSSSSASSSSSDDESNGHKSRSKSSSLMKPHPNNMYSSGWMPNPDTGEWFPAQYMYTPFFPGMAPMRPYFNPNYRGNYPRRGRGRGRGYYNNETSRYHRRSDDDYYNEHDDRRSYSRSPRRRSYSRSKSRTRTRRRRSYSRSRSSRSSRSRSNHRRSRSHSSRSRSHSKSDRRQRSISKPKLVTTLRDGNTKKTPPTRQNDSRSRSGSGWSSDNDNHKRKKRRTWSREASPSKGGIETNKLMKSARDIQRHVQQKLKEQQEAEERKMKEQEKQLEVEAEEIERRMEKEANGIESPQSDKNDQQSAKTPELYTPPPQETFTPEITA